MILAYNSLTQDNPKKTDTFKIKITLLNSLHDFLLSPITMRLALILVRITNLN